MERPDLYVLARFLDVLHSSGQPMKKTNLQMRVGLNFPRFMEYGRDDSVFASRVVGILSD